jgi:hypothetical protein
MAGRADLIVEARELLDRYREVAAQTPTPEDLEEVGLALWNAVSALETQDALETLEHAAAQIAAARETLDRVRRALER